MKLIKRDADYAVRAICYIANSKEIVVSAAEMVKALKIPRPFLRKILQILNKKGILASSKGKGGGFSLAIVPDKIHLTDIVEAFQGPIRLNECLFKRDLCHNRKTCPLKKKIDGIEKYVLGELRSVTIGELLGRGR
jgi:Rrf2 family protein